MNAGRKIGKHNRAKQHRIEQYEKAIQGVIDGTIQPEYATERWRKVKQVRGNK